MDTNKRILYDMKSELEIPVAVRQLEAAKSRTMAELVNHIDDVSWIDYESFMKAKIIHGEAGEDGLLLVAFESAMGLDQGHLHSHDYSDRQVLGLEGQGFFHYAVHGGFASVPIQQHTYLQFPHGLLHTFTTDKSPLLLLSAHLPFLPLDDPRALTEYKGPIPRFLH